MNHAIKAARIKKKDALLQQIAEDMGEDSPLFDIGNRRHLCQLVFARSVKLFFLTAVLNVIKRTKGALLQQIFEDMGEDSPLFDVGNRRHLCQLVFARSVKLCLFNSSVKCYRKNKGCSSAANRRRYERGSPSVYY